MNPDFQFVRDPVDLHMLFWRRHQTAYHPDLTPESEMESIFPHYDLNVRAEVQCCINTVSYLSRWCTSWAALL